VDREQALRELRAIEQAGRRARRHSLNNGLIPLALGLVILLGLPLYDFAPGAARVFFPVVVALLAAWIPIYASRIGVQADRASLRRYALLLIGGMACYAVVLLAGQLLLKGRTDYPSTILAPFAAAPLLLGGGWLFWRATR
jgi:hypothetical protein